MLRRTFLTLTLFSVVPLLLLTVLYQVYLSREADQRISDFLSENIQRIDVGFNRFLGERMSDVQAWAKMGVPEVGIEYDRPEALEDFLSDLKTNYHVYAHVAVFNQSGVLFAADVETQSEISKSILSLPFPVESETEDKGFAKIVSLQNKKFLVLSNPIQNRFKQPLGWIAAFISWDQVIEALHPSGDLSSLESGSSTSLSAYGEDLKSLASAPSVLPQDMLQKAIQERGKTFMISAQDKDLAFACLRSTPDALRGAALVQCLQADRGQVLKHLNVVRSMAIIIAILSIAIIAWLSFLITKRLLKPLNEIVADLARYGRTGEKSAPSMSLDGLKTMVLRLIEDLVSSQKKLHEESEKAKIGEMASRIAHDIQSPLAVLSSVIEDQSKFPQENQQELLRSVTSQIQALADGLLSRYRKPNGAEESQFTFLALTVQSIVAEKTLLLKDGRIRIHTKISDESSFEGVAIPRSDLLRVFSNLINNSIDALHQHEQGEICIELSNSYKRENNHGNWIHLRIRDNGCGMDALTLECVRRGAGSIGKPGGSGIGLQHAREVIEGVGGSIEIFSEKNQGTEVTLNLPLATAPRWLASDLEFDPHKSIVIIDDSESLHQLWREKLKTFDVVFLRDPAEFAIDRFPPTSHQYLIDYEFSGSTVTGLDLMRKYNLANHAVLVTSYFYESKILRAVEALKTKLLPKPWIARAQIKTMGIIVNRPPSGRIDMVLLDNDPSIRKLWAYQAKNYGKTILTVERLDELNLEKLNPETEIFIDRRLSDNMRGVDIAEHLFKKGFRKLYLATADPSDLENCTVLSGIVGKEFPVQQLS